jgi:hypothetical protein
MYRGEVIADPFMVCKDCPASGNLSAIEHHRRCYGRIPGAIGAAACGKKVIPTRAVELFPEMFKTED